MVYHTLDSDKSTLLNLVFQMFAFCLNSMSPCTELRNQSSLKQTL